MSSAELYEWMANPSLLTKFSLQELRQMMDDYPYFHAIRMLYLKNLAVLQDVRLEKELKKMSIFIPDRRLLYTLIHEQPPAGRWSPVGEQPSVGLQASFSERSPVDEQPPVENKGLKPEPPPRIKDKTETVIDVVEKAIPADEPDEKDFVSSLLPKPVSPVAATSDYANWLAQNTEDLPTEDGTGKQLKHQHLIDSFIAIDGNQLAQRLSNPVAAKPPELAVEDETSNLETLEKSSLDDSYFTETLARVYMSQKRYDKALEIIRVLSLKYPKKNSYFADQIRYLEKIINIKK